MAGDGIVAWSEASSVDVGGFIIASDYASAGGPGVGELLLRFEVCCGTCNGYRVARVNIGWLNGATELDGWRRLLLSEPQNYSGGEAVGGDLANASGYLGGIKRAVIDMGVVEVCLD
jgi:hypothetical protein